MNNQLTKWLKLVCQNAWQELLQRPIATTRALFLILFGIVVVLSPALLIGFLREKIWSLLLTTMPLTMEMNIILIGLSFLVLLYSFFYLLKQGRKEKFHFVAYAGFAWKVNTPQSGEIWVDSAPYCEKHQIELVEADSRMVCILCGSESAKKVTRYYLEKTHELVKNVVIAQREGHLVIKSNHNSPP